MTTSEVLFCERNGWLKWEAKEKSWDDKAICERNGWLKWEVKEVVC